MAWGNFGWAWEPLLAKMRRGESHVVILPWPKSLATSTAGLTLSGSFCYIHSAAVPSLLLSPDALLHLAVVPPMLPPMLLLPMAVLPLLPPVLLYTAALPPATSCTAPNRGCSTQWLVHLCCCGKLLCSTERLFHHCSLQWLLHSGWREDGAETSSPWQVSGTKWNITLAFESVSLCTPFIQSLQRGHVPSQWKASCITNGGKAVQCQGPMAFMSVIERLIGLDML